MNLSADLSFSTAPLPTVVLRRRTRRGAFALVITLLILSLLIIVAVSYLSSMVSERQTADAYTSKARAEQVAQSGVDSAMAILTQSFRDFPDSATVWDTQQSSNSGAATTYNEGTSLYLRAVPDANGLANPQINSTGGTTAPANDSNGNNPGNPACKTFVLPLISGVSKGQAQLVSNKAAILPTPMNVSDPTNKQNFTDLNVRSNSTDTQGFIGSPPGWTGGPKPARAYWINLKSNDGRTTGRYAFWMEDESFRANNSFAGAATTPPDNQAQPTPSGSTIPRSLQAGDLMLAGPLTLAGDSNAGNDAGAIADARKIYPGNFFPDPLAFRHSAADGTSSFGDGTSKFNWLHYLTTNQSGTLNLTRHGTQRFNLNGVLTAASVQTQVNQIVQAMKFHLPYLGQRFYRTSTQTTSAVLNSASQVPGSPVASGPVNTHSNIYYYKVAANLLDYVDADSQPTVIDNAGNVLTLSNPASALNVNSYPGPSEIWAQGKEGGPYLQEVAVRLRPVVYTTHKSIPYNFDLKIDYYLEFWNMTDRDIYASAQSGSNSSLPNLGGATIHVSNQQTWKTYPSGGVVTCSGQNPNALTYRDASTDYEIDLSGVVFKAGACTVITTDPDYAGYTFAGPPKAVSLPATNYPSLNTSMTFYCPLISGQREYAGTIKDPDYGLQTVFRNPTTGNSKEDDELEVVLSNSRGYIDSVLFAVSEHGVEQWTGTDAYVGQPGNYNDYSYSSCLFGNYTDSNLYYAVTPSELGDPRTNNEQLNVTQSYDAAKAGDQSRFIYGSAKDTTLGYPNPSQKPDQGGYPWPDYYAMPAATGGVVPAPDATTAPMVVANAPMTSVGQLGDVFDPARMPGPAGILYSRGGGRTFKIGQHDDRYSSDPTGNLSPNNTSDNVPASNGWAAWRLADIFDVSDSIEAPACININGVLRDKGATLLALLQGFQFQPSTTVANDPNNKPYTPPTSDPVIHGDGHPGSGLAKQPLDTSATGTAGFAMLLKQMTDRLTPTAGTNSPFFERGELGELGTNTTPLFGKSPTTAYDPSNKLLVSSVDMNKTFDHGREELLRRIAQMICTRGDTFTVYAVGQSISQPTLNSDLRVTGTHRMRVTFRLVPKAKDPNNPGAYVDFHPGYTIDNTTGAVTPITNNYADLTDTSPNGRFAKPDHYVAQILQTTTY